MIHTTTPHIEGRTITDYHGVVTGEAIIGIDIDYETVGERGAMLRSVFREQQSRCVRIAAHGH